MVKMQSYLNLAEILPDCFTKEAHTNELMERIDDDYRILPDKSHICSVKFLENCLECFKKQSDS